MYKSLAQSLEQDLSAIHILANIFTPHKERCIIVRRQQCFIMAEKQQHSSARDFHNCSSKLVCPVSLLIAALVHVEIINQRVHDVEELWRDRFRI